MGLGHADVGEDLVSVCGARAGVSALKLKGGIADGPIWPLRTCYGMRLILEMLHVVEK